eukprot:6018392-Amphidinium_carterae.1
MTDIEMYHRGMQQEEPEERETNTPMMKIYHELLNYQQTTYEPFSENQGGRSSATKQKLSTTTVAYFSTRSTTCYCL